MNILRVFPLHTHNDHISVETWNPYIQLQKVLQISGTEKLQSIGKNIPELQSQ